MRETIHSIFAFIHESQIVTGVIFGMVMQFFFVSTKTWRIAVSITFSSVFLAVYVISPIIEVSGIDEHSKLAVGLYALSSLISMEMLAILLVVTPEAMKAKLRKMLGV